MRAVTRPASLGGACVWATVSVARSLVGLVVARPLATRTAMASPAPRATPRATRGDGSSPRSPSPSSAPSAPPAVPATAAQIKPSGSSEPFQGSG